MKHVICLAALLVLTACASEEPERPDEADEARFHEIDAMLDQEGGAPEDTPPSNAAAED